MSELSDGLLSVGGGRDRRGAGCGRSSEGGLKISGAPFGTVVKGLYRLDGVLDEGSSELEKSCSKSLVTVLGKGSGVATDNGEKASSAVSRDEPKRSWIGGSCLMVTSLAAGLRNGFVTTGCGEGKSPASSDGDVNGSAKVLGGA